MVTGMSQLEHGQRNVATSNPTWQSPASTGNRPGGWSTESDFPSELHELPGRHRRWPVLECEDFGKGCAYEPCDEAHILPERAASQLGPFEAGAVRPSCGGQRRWRRSDYRDAACNRDRPQTCPRSRHRIRHLNSFRYPASSNVIPQIAFRVTGISMPRIELSPVLTTRGSQPHDTRQ